MVKPYGEYVGLCNAFYLTLKYEIDCPILVVNDRNMELFLHQIKLSWTERNLFTFETFYYK